jgi:hypothetical protein
MRNRIWVIAAFLAGFSMFSAGPAGAAELEFDDATLFGGTVTGDEADITGTNIIFDQVTGIGTPSNDGVVLDISGGDLDFFVDGGSLVVANIVSYSGTGTFTLSGTVTDPNNGDAVVATGVLLSGTFDSATFILQNGGLGGTFTGDGSDEKNQDLLDFYGITATDFNFLNTDFSLTGCTTAAGGTPALTSDFTCSIANADLNNTGVPIAEPATLGLFGIGLLGLGFMLRRRKRLVA